MTEDRQMQDARYVEESLDALEKAKKLIMAGKATRVQVVLFGNDKLYRFTSSSPDAFGDAGRLLMLAMELLSGGCDLDIDKELKDAGRPS